MPVPPATLSGGSTEVGIDQANQAMRAMPWYSDLLRSMGKDPNGPIKLSKEEGKKVLQGAQANGFVVDEGDMHVDESGNLDKKGHAVRNTIIVLGIAGATVATMGAAGAFAGAAGAAGAGAGGGGAAGAGAAGLGASGVGGLTATSLGLGTTAGLGTAGGVGAGLAAGGAAAGGLAGGGGAAAGGAGTVGTLGTAAKVGQALSGGNGIRGYLDTAGQVSNVLGGISAGRAAGRAAETMSNERQDQLALQRYGQQQQNAASQNTYGLNTVSTGLAKANTDLARRQFSLSAPGQRASNSVRGDILANAQDASISAPSTIPVPQISGGLRPSMFSANTRALGGEMSAQALASQQAGDQFEALPDLAPYVAPPPMQIPLGQEQSGKTDSILNTAATVGQLGGLIGNIAYRRKPQDIYEEGGG